ncbi:MAG: MFS transporter [Streptosporangiaceae bacterium]|jgi:MFS family permease
MELDSRVRREAWILIIAGLFMSASQSLSSVALPIVLLEHGSGAGGVGTVLALMNLAGMAELLVVGAYADRGWIRFFLIFFPFTSLLGVIPFLTPRTSLLWLGIGTVVGGFGGGAGATSVLGFFIREPEHREAAPQPAQHGWTQRLSHLQIPKKSRWLLLRLSITNGLNGLATGTYGMFLTTWLVLRFHASVGELGLINVLIAGTAMFGDLACPFLARRAGLVRAVIVTRVVQALLIIPIAFAPTIVVAQILLIWRQFMQRLNTALRDSYTLGQADPGEKARMTAMSNIASSGAQSLSAQVAGQVIDRIGFTIPFVFSAFAQLASSLVFFAFFARRPPPEEVTEPERAAGRAAANGG